MIKKIFIVLMLMSSFTLFGDIIEYNNNDAKFSFKYPSDFKIYDNILIEHQSNSYVLQITYEKIENIEVLKESELPFISGYDRDSTKKLNNALKKGVLFNNFYNSINPEVVKIDKSYALSFSILSFFASTDDIVFLRRLVFFSNGYRIIITLSADAFKKQIIEGMSNYFTNGTSWLLGSYKDGHPEENAILNGFIKTLKNKKGCKEAQYWYDSFDDIIKSIKIDVKDIDPNNLKNAKKLYKSTIDNLRFRETPTLDGKFIRLLVKGEKLELIEKGKEETVNGVKGTWIKVKTEKGEVGWAFDAYLKEIDR